MLVSKYGFSDVLGRDVILDPSRVAAQIVTGVGFIGGGLIFMRGHVVQGLTTAAVIWVTAAIGMACGAGLPILALAVTVAHFIVVFVFPSVAGRLPQSRYLGLGLRVVYEDGRGVLRDVLTATSASPLCACRPTNSITRSAACPPSPSTCNSRDSLPPTP